MEYNPDCSESCMNWYGVLKVAHVVVVMILKPTL
jgi:hypothetical protein